MGFAIKCPKKFLGFSRNLKKNLFYTFLSLFLPARNRKKEGGESTWEDGGGPDGTLGRSKGSRGSVRAFWVILVILSFLGHFGPFFGQNRIKTTSRTMPRHANDANLPFWSFSR